MDQESIDDKDVNTISSEAMDENTDDNGVVGTISPCSSLHHTSSSCNSRRPSLCSTEGDKTEKLLKILQFRNPGPQLATFDPDKSRREQRKVRQFVKTAEKDMYKYELDGKKDRCRRKNGNPPKRRNYHDRSGIRLSDNKDVCDCQDLNCPGCHFPCESCGSEKCGVECRCSRRWTYEAHVTIENPFLSKTDQTL